MERAVATTSTAPAARDPAELQRMLSEMPRRELQALSQSHGVKATLKSETIVGMLMGVLQHTLWPASSTEQSADTSSDDHHSEEKKKKDDTTQNDTTEDDIDASATCEINPETPESKVSSSTSSASARSSVGKKAAVKQLKAAISPSSFTSPPAKTPTKAKATSKAMMDKIHAKHMAKQPTLQEHEKMKRERAAVLLSGSKFSSVKKTRSKTKALAEAAAADPGINKSLTFNGVPKSPAASKSTATPAQSSQGATQKGKKVAYKPYKGPVPPFEGDSLFSPNKPVSRAAPMSVAVMKAARVRTPVKGSQPMMKRNSKTASLTKASSKSETRQSVKAATSSKQLSLEVKKGERRLKADQADHAKRASARQAARRQSNSTQSTEPTE
ncbi:hypothetical protein PINS_up008136 [Pythium insidiosum]|nr:hypothetical protein PINS_up008136 [Pythium insidiosum]